MQSLAKARMYGESLNYATKEDGSILLLCCRGVGHRGLCDEVRTAVAVTGKFGKTQFELVVEAYSWLKKGFVVISL